MFVQSSYVFNSVLQTMAASNRHTGRLYTIYRQVIHYTGRLYTIYRQVIHYIQAGYILYRQVSIHRASFRQAANTKNVYCVVCIVEHALQSWVHVTAGATIWHLKSYHHILYRNCILTSRRKLFKYFSLSQEPSYVITLSCWRLSQHKQIVARPALL